MQYTRMGTTGAQVSRLCLGCMSFGTSFADWTIGEPAAHALVRKAVEGGLNFFDTAGAYGRGESEEILGRAIKALGLRRDETKKEAAFLKKSGAKNIFMLGRGL